MAKTTKKAAQAKTTAEDANKKAAKKKTAKKSPATKSTTKKAAVKKAPAKKAAAKKVAAKSPTRAKSSATPHEISAAQRHQLIAEAAYLRSEAQGFLGNPGADCRVADARRLQFCLLRALVLGG